MLAIALQPVARLLALLCHLLRHMARRILIAQHEVGARWQVGQDAGWLMQIGQVVGDVGERLALAQRLQIVLPAVAGGGIEAHRVERGEARGSLLPARGQRLARGGQQRLGHGVERALCLWVEGADALDLVAEELDANRALHRGGEDIDDAATMRALAHLLGLGLEVVAEHHQALQQQARIEALAGGQRKHGGAKLVWWHDRLGERTRRADDDGGIADVIGRLRQQNQRVHARFDGVAVGQQSLPGQRVERGKRADGDGATCEHGQRLGDALHLIVVARDIE